MQERMNKRKMDLNLSKVYIVLGLTYHLSKVIGQVEMLINCNYANSKNHDYISTSMIIIQKLNLPSTHSCQYLEVIQFGFFFFEDGWSLYQNNQTLDKLK